MNFSYRVMNFRLAALGAVVVLAATALVQGQTTSAALAATVCNRYCDGRDPGLAPADQVPVSSTLYGRSFKVHVNATDAMVWGSVENGQSGDEVWLDRSFDGGRSWSGGSRLGDTGTPGAVAGSTGVPPRPPRTPSRTACSSS
jgi:hypothetical protein